MVFTHQLLVDLTFSALAFLLLLLLLLLLILLLRARLVRADARLALDHPPFTASRRSLTCASWAQILRMRCALRQLTCHRWPYRWPRRRGALVTEMPRCGA